MGIEDGSSIWFTSVFSSTQFTVIDFKHFTVNQPATKTCNIEPIVADGDVEDGFVFLFVYFCFWLIFW